MLMVCPNCKSNEVISVQNQHFCISCGQMVPDVIEAPAKPVAAAGPVKVQSNGLPEGVEILPLAPVPTPVSASSTSASPTLIHGRSRFGSVTDQAPVVMKRRKPGRPKAGRLDVPAQIVPATAAEKAAPVVTALPLAQPAPEPPKTTAKKSQARPAKASTATPAAPAKLPRSPLAASQSSGPRRLNDIAPRRPSAPGPAPASAVSNVSPVGNSKAAKAAIKAQKRSKRHAHRVGVPALHYGPVLSFSLRARARPRLVALASLGAVSLGAASAYGVYQLLSGGIPQLANSLMSAGPQLIGGTLALLMIYYIGRSLGQAAITYGIAREADQRPVTLSRQFGVAVNTFGRRLRLDTGFALAELVIVAAAALLLVTGGNPWPVPANIQISSIFLAYLALLYFWISLVLARGLAGVNLTLTQATPFAAARTGWQLFSHRLELIGPRFTSLMLEAALALPLLALVVAVVISTPAGWHATATVAAGLLAWLAGALLGVGTAAWWAMLYRQLVTADRPDAAVSLLSGRQPEDARRLPLALIIAVSTFLVSAALIIPWISLF